MYETLAVASICPRAVPTVLTIRNIRVAIYANNRVENSHLPFRRRERAMLRFRQMKSLQKFATVQASISNHFNSERHLVDRETCKTRRSAALAEWQFLAA